MAEIYNNNYNIAHKNIGRSNAELLNGQNKLNQIKKMLPQVLGNQRNYYNEQN